MFQLRIDSYLSSLLLSKLSTTSGLDQSQEFSTRPCDLHQLIQGDYSLIPVVAGVSLYIGLLLSQALQFCQREVEAEPVGDVSLVIPVDVIIVVVHVVGGKSVLKLRSLGDISSEVKVRFVGADKLVILRDSQVTLDQVCPLPGCFPVGQSRVLWVHPAGSSVTNDERSEGWQSVLAIEVRVVI